MSLYIDISWREDREENPVTKLARGLSDVNIHDLAEKARQTVKELKGEP